MSQYPLYQQVTAIADSNGRATVTTGPAKYGDVWNVTTLTTESNSVSDVQLLVYRNVETPGARIESSYSGKSDTSQCNYTFNAAERLVFVWSGATPGAACTSRIEGSLISGRV